MQEAETSSDLKILIIDENKNLADLMTRYLSLKGYEMMYSSTISDAISSMKKNRPDIIFLDPTFREHTNEEILNELHQNNLLKIHRVILFSGTCNQKFIENWKSLGIYSYIEKPANPQNILGFLENELQCKQNLEENFSTEKSQMGNNVTETVMEKHESSKIPDINKTQQSTSISEERTSTQNHEKPIPNKLDSVVSGLLSTKTNLKIVSDVDKPPKDDRSIEPLPNKLDSVVSGLLSTRDESIHTKDPNTSHVTSEKKKIENELHDIMRELSEIRNELHFELEKNKQGKKVTKGLSSKSKKNRKRKHSTKRKTKRK